MRELHIRGEVIRTIEWLYKQTKIKTRFDEIKLGQGVIQGGVLSPTLFLIMFNDLLVELKDKGFQVFAYADDLAIAGRNTFRLKEAIDIVTKWTKENEMKINKKKSILKICQII